MNGSPQSHSNPQAASEKRPHLDDSFRTPSSRRVQHSFEWVGFGEAAPPLVIRA
jgi:hypothetical protein